MYIFICTTFRYVLQKSIKLITYYTVYEIERYKEIYIRHVGKRKGGDRQKPKKKKMEEE